LVVLVALFALCNGHAYITTPPGWNPSPSTSPCTSFKPATVALASWRADEQASIVWTVIAGDGVGPVSLYIDPAGGEFNGALSNYTQIELSNEGASTTVAAHTFLFTVPDVNCTGPNKLCSIMAIATSNWKSCSTITILPPCTTNCTAPPPPPPHCVEATGMTFCSSLNQHAVMVPTGFDAATMDASASLTYTNYLANPKVFSNGNDPTCAKDYKAFLCALNTPPCPGSDGVAVGAACHSMCQAAMAACQLNATHANLYPCESYPLCPGEAAASTYTPFFTMIALLSLLTVL